jgi:hypothetical protein
MSSTQNIGGFNSFKEQKLLMQLLLKKVKYAYQEWRHSADTASTHCPKVEWRREHGYTIINFKIDGTNN